MNFDFADSDTILSILELLLERKVFVSIAEDSVLIIVQEPLEPVVQ